MGLQSKALFWTLMGGSSTVATSTAVSMLSAEQQGLALDFTDSFFFSRYGIYGSACVKDLTTIANNYNSIPGDLLTYTGTTKMTRQSDGVYRYAPHNLYVNSATPANQSITVVSGASYSVTITGSVSVTASGAATGTWTAGTTTFTAATATLTLGSTSGSGTVHVRRTPSDSTYLATGASAKYGLPFEWNTSGVLQGILVEPQATNVILNSLTFVAGTGGSVSTSATTDPTGLLTSVDVTEDTSTGIHRGMSGTYPATAATIYTASFYVLKTAARRLNVNCSALLGLQTLFDLSSGSVIATSGAISNSIIDCGSFWKVSVTGTGTGVAARIFFELCLPSYSLASAQPYTGDGTSKVTLWHHQLETGSVATSPIITYAASATRAADNISLNQTSFPIMSSSGYSMFTYAELPSGPNSSYPAMSRLRNVASTETANLNVNTTGTIKLYAVSGGVAYADLSSGVAQSNGVPFKVAGSWALNDFRVCANGSAVASDTSGTNPSTFTVFEMTGAYTYAPVLVKSVSVIPRTRTNAELQTVTT